MKWTPLLVSSIEAIHIVNKKYFQEDEKITTGKLKLSNLTDKKATVVHEKLVPFEDLDRNGPHSEAHFDFVTEELGVQVQSS